MSDAKPLNKSYEVLKVIEELGVIVGWGSVCKTRDAAGDDFEVYEDLQGDTITEDAIFKAAVDFADGMQASLDEHKGEPMGKVVGWFPLTEEVAAALEIETNKTGLLCMVKPNDEMLEKFKSGEYSAFSIGGAITEHDA